MMSKKNFYACFIHDRYYLLKYYLLNLTILGSGCLVLQLQWSRLQDFNHLWLWLIGLILFVLPNFSMIFFSGLFYLGLYLYSQPIVSISMALILILSGTFVGIVSASMIHNASHNNFRPKRINRFLGELNGLFQLSGFAGWTISHTIHHSSPDDPIFDAHPPGTLTFRNYQNLMGTQMKNNLTKKYFDTFGRTLETERIWKTITILLPCVRYIRVLFVMMLLGPMAFTFFFATFKIVNALIFSDFNYRTHRPNQNGDIEILNLNHNLFYKFLNSISWGSYYHKNHHRKPNVLDPRKITSGVDEPMISFSSS